MGNTLEDALARIEELENENKKLRAELEVYKNEIQGEERNMMLHGMLHIRTLL